MLFRSDRPGRIELADISLQHGAAESLSSDEGLGLILQSGGAVTAWTVTATRVAFVDNGGGICGGAVSLLGNYPALVGGSLLYDLSPRGREINFDNARSTFVDASFIGNSADFAGGAVAGMSLNLEGAPEDGWLALLMTETFFCGAPPTSIERSTFTGNEALVGGAVYSVDPRTAMEIGKEIGESDVASARPFTSRRMKELYEMPALVVSGSNFVDNRATGRNLLGITGLPGIGGGAIFTSGVAKISRSTFTGNGSPEEPVDDYDVTVGGGAVAACGYIGTSNSYDQKIGRAHV